jgi:hypothetical protein
VGLVFSVVPLQMDLREQVHLWWLLDEVLIEEKRGLKPYEKLVVMRPS